MLVTKILAALLHASKNCNSGPTEKSDDGGENSNLLLFRQYCDEPKNTAGPVFCPQKI